MGSIRELWDNMIAKIKASGKQADDVLDNDVGNFLEQLKEKVHELESKIDGLEQNERFQIQSEHMSAIEKRIASLESYIIPEGATEMIDLVVTGLKIIAESNLSPGAKIKPVPSAADPVVSAIIPFPLKPLTADESNQLGAEQGKQDKAADPVSIGAAAVDASVGPRGHA